MCIGAWVHPAYWYDDDDNDTTWKGGTTAFKIKLGILEYTQVNDCYLPLCWPYEENFYVVQAQPHLQVSRRTHRHGPTHSKDKLELHIYIIIFPRHTHI